MMMVVEYIGLSSRSGFPFLSDQLLPCQRGGKQMSLCFHVDCVDCAKLLRGCPQRANSLADRQVQFQADDAAVIHQTGSATHPLTVI